MDANELKQAAAVMMWAAEHPDGEIEYIRQGDEHVDKIKVGLCAWNWGIAKYRISKELSLRNLTPKEQNLRNLTPMEALGKMVRRKDWDTKRGVCITEVGEDLVFAQNLSIFYTDLRTNWVQTNGEPCGVKEGG